METWVCVIEIDKEYDFPSWDVTYGKRYEVSDRGKMDQFMAKRFKLLSDIREEKLKELGLLDECPIPNERV